jgi:hypothetical protein
MTNQRLGVHVLASIDRKLRGIGLGHLPAELPTRQADWVILYQFATPQPPSSTRSAISFSETRSSP